MRVIFLGPPGAGKGTQSQFLQERWSIPELSTGKMLRHEVEQGTDVGRKAQETLDSGQLVSDQILIDMIRSHLKDESCSNGFILDGFPRNIPQAEALSVVLSEINIHLDAVIEIRINDFSSLVNRIIGRYVCAQCNRGYSDVEKSQIPKVNGVCDDCGSKEFNRRSDDNREVLEKRIEVYKDQTAHLIPFFKENYKLISVDGEQEITKVSEDIEIAMRSIQTR